MFHAGIEVTDADSAMTAADVEDEVELVDVVCPECNGARSIYDLSHELGWIDIECPCCGGWGTIEVTADGSDDWDDPEPPTPAVHALAFVALPVRYAACRDTLRIVKPGGRFAGRPMLEFFPNCTQHGDVATGTHPSPTPLVSCRRCDATAGS